MNNGDYKNKKTFNNQRPSNGNFMSKKRFNQDSRDDIYTPKTYPKKQKISQFDAILDSIAASDYMSAKNQARDKRQRDLDFKRQKRK